MKKRKKNTTMETYPLELSIIIPVYNTPLSYVRECLASIDLAQIRYCYEVIIVNDGSTDRELTNYLKDYKNERTTVIHKENSGVSASRNIGLKQAKGNFLLCLDSDDKLLPAISHAVSYLKSKTSYDILYCDLQFFGDTKYLHRKCEFSKFQLMYVSNMLTPSSTLFSKRIISEILFNENLSYSEDRDFFSRAASLGFQFKHFRYPFCLYRRIFNSQSLSQKNVGMKNEIESFIKSQFDVHTELHKKK
ncbi:glycosyltransferase family 2 protein [Chryseobacterium sp. S90]|uniref:glycosyltransferase family 2 protein n=1 Tax=Chryseobacterium sp. S90 TaxID=3395373 RepID=UPI0039BCD7E3